MGELEIGENLGVMDRYQHLDGFYLNDQKSFDPDVQSQIGVECYPVLANRHLDLSFSPSTKFSEFVKQTCLVDAFEQARPEFSVYLDRSPNNLIR